MCLIPKDKVPFLPVKTKSPASAAYTIGKNFSGD